MKSWLLITLDESERIYKGHLGYEDELSSVYRYDSFVPNHKQLSPGDAVFLRGKTSVLGCAVIERIDARPGAKRRHLCPECGSTKLKERMRMRPSYRCECGATFDRPHEREEACTEYEAWFGSSFQTLENDLSIEQLWLLAPRLNKQLSILELDSRSTADILRTAVVHICATDSLPMATAPLFQEGERRTVLVDRYERDPRARRACIEHYGARCCACGFAFRDIYGPLGEGVIEVHHLALMSGAQGVHQVDPVRDLRPLCSNCHTMAHRKQPPLSIEELKSLLQ